MSYRSLASDLAPPSTEYDLFPGNFILVCPELRQSQQPPALRCTTNNFFALKDETWFFNTFATPIHAAQRRQRFRPRFGSRYSRLSKLELLPTELIEDILDYLLAADDEKHDGGSDRTGSDKLGTAMDSVLALGLSSGQLWPKILARIHRDYRRAISESWAGKRVGLHGAHSWFTDPQLEHYHIDKPRYVRKRVHYWPWSPVMNQPSLPWSQRIRRYSPSLKEISKRDRGLIVEDLSQHYLYPQKEIWLLRNLTTKQLVVSEDLHAPSSAIPGWKLPPEPISALKRALNFITSAKTADVPQEQSEPQGTQTYTLTQIFLYLTSFSNALEIPTPQQYLAFQRGPWVGHTFDVVLNDEHMKQRNQELLDVESDSEGETGTLWRNITEDVAADLGNLQWCLQQYQEIRQLKGARRKSAEKEFWNVVAEVRPVHRRWAENNVTTLNELSSPYARRRKDHALQTLSNLVNLERMV